MAYFKEVKVIEDEKVGTYIEDNIVYQLYNKITITFQTDETDFTFELQYIFEGENRANYINSSSYTLTQDSLGVYKVIFNLKDYSELTLTKGRKFYLRLYGSKYINGVTSSGTYKIENILFCRPYDNTKDTIANSGFKYSIITYPNANNDKYCGPLMGIIVENWPNKEVEGPYPDLSKIYIRELGEDKSPGSSVSIPSGSWIDDKKTISIHTQSGTHYLEIKIIDKANTVIEIETKEYSEGRSSITFDENVKITYEPGTYNPHKNKDQSLAIEHGHATAYGSSREYIGYKYSFLDINGESIYITPDSYDLESAQDQIIAIFTRTTLVENNIFKEDTKSGMGIQKIRIAATDAFGNRTSIDSSFPYDYYLEPVWFDETQLRVRHDFYGGEEKTEVEEQDIHHSINQDYTLDWDLSMFCTQESAVLYLPPSVGENGEGPTFVIEMAKAPYDGDIYDYNEFIYEYVGEKKNESNSNSLMVFKYLIEENYDTNYQCYFRVAAKDSRGATTSYKYSPVIFFSRMENPSFAITSTEFSVNEDDELNVLFKKEQNILDLGCGKFHLIEYIPTYYNPTVKVHIEVSQNANFENSKKEALSFTQTSESESLLEQLEGDWSCSFAINPELDGWDKTWQYKKVYARVWLEVFYNRNQSLTLVSEPYTCFTVIGGIPTVAHRKNHVGINSYEFDENCVLKISPFESENLRRTQIQFSFLEGEDTLILDLSSKQNFIASLKNVLGIS